MRIKYKAAATEKGGNSIHAMSSEAAERSRIFGKLGAASSMCGSKVRPTGRDFDITESHACRNCKRVIGPTDPVKTTMPVRRRRAVKS